MKEERCLPLHRLLVATCSDLIHNSEDRSLVYALYSTNKKFRVSSYVNTACLSNSVEKEKRAYLFLPLSRPIARLIDSYSREESRITEMMG